MQTNSTPPAETTQANNDRLPDPPPKRESAMSPVYAYRIVREITWTGGMPLSLTRLERYDVTGLQCDVVAGPDGLTTVRQQYDDIVMDEVSK